MAESKTLQTEVVIAGGGLAGIAAAHELLDRGKRVLLIDKDQRANFGGLAKQSFGGVHLIGTPHQRRLGIQDSPELAWRDWLRRARFEADDYWPREWARRYCETSIPAIYEFLTSRKIQFLPLVNWAERGLDEAGNTVPRWHITWGTGFEIIDKLLQSLESHAHRPNLDVRFETEVYGLDTAGERVTGVLCRRGDGTEFRVAAEQVLIASGGMCGGDMSKLRAHWYKPWGEAPEKLLNGAHDYGDGLLQDRAADLGAAVTHLDRQWHYPAGVHHPARRRPNDGLSLVPPRGAVWVNARGQRILNPGPLTAYTDTRHLVASILQQPGQYSWQVLNWKIAVRELAVSGCDYMTAFRYKKRLSLARSVLFGNKEVVERLLRDCPEDVVAAATLDELMEEMDRRSLYGLKLDREELSRTLHDWDGMIARGPAFHNDDQLRRLANARAYRGDRVRTCAFQRILDRRAGPLIAIREFILARKSLGGIQTDLECRVLRASDGQPVPGLYAAGEAAGFGGGGIHGEGSLEGTFLGGCVLTGRAAGQWMGN